MTAGGTVNGTAERLNLLFVIKSLAAAGGGAERVLCEVGSGLAERGHNVAIATYDAPGAPSFYPLAQDIKRIGLGLGRADRSTSLRETLGRLPALRHLANELRPDMVIGFMHSVYVPLAAALAGTGRPLVASEHIVYRHFVERPLERLLIHLTAPMLNAMTTISSETRATFPASLARRMTVLPNPVTVPSGTYSDPRGAPGHRKILLTVGRLEKQKDHRTLLTAFATLADEFPDWDLRVVGEGSLRGELEAQIEREGLEGRVQLPGTITDMDGEYRAAQLFVMPSSYESFGLATAEALAHGLPAVGFADCPGTNALISNGSNGLLVEGKDRPLALAEGLRKAMADEVLRARLAAQAPASVADYGLSDVLDAWEALLRSVRRRRGQALELTWTG